jgi:type IV pilus assembly protein PilC
LIPQAVENVSEWTDALQPLAESWPTGDLRREMLGINRDLQAFGSGGGMVGGRPSEGGRQVGKRLVRAVPYAISDDATAFEGWARAIKNDSERTGRFMRLMLYPAVLAAAAVSVCVWVTFAVIPIFDELFTEFGLSLPAGTKLLLDASEFVREHLLLFLVGCVVCFLLICGLLLFVRARALPTRLFGSWASGTAAALAATSFFARSTAELLANGVSAAEAIEFSGQHCGHATLRDDALRLASLVENGARQECVEANAQFVPRTLLRALYANQGRPSVSLLKQLAESYRKRSERTASVLEFVLPPIAVVLIGLFIGFLLITLFSPLLTMVTSLA